MNGDTLHRCSRTAWLKRWLGGGALALLVMHSPPSPALDAVLEQSLRQVLEAQGIQYQKLRPAGTPRIRDRRAALGRALFFSRTLSGREDASCASCHHPLLGGGDGLSLSVGVESIDPSVIGIGRAVSPRLDQDPKAQRLSGPNVPRNAQTIFNSTLYQQFLFHDGRVRRLGQPHDGQLLIRTPESPFRASPDPWAKHSLLSAQARFPLVAFNEMRSHGDFYALSPNQVRAAIVARLRDEDSGWPARFEAAFGPAETTEASPVTIERLTEALAAYQASQVFVDNYWARYLKGTAEAISDAAKRGALLFYRAPDTGGFGCASCHSGPRFTDEQFHNTGFPQFGRGKRTDDSDPGRYLVTQEPTDRFRFRTPSLLNTEVTGPWGHTGAFNDLGTLIAYHANPRAAIDHYDFSLQSLPQFRQRNIHYPNAEKLTRATLDTLSPRLPHKTPDPQQVADLKAFLHALTDPCTENPACLKPWIANEQDNVDGNMLMPTLSPGYTPEILASNPKPRAGSHTAAVKKPPAMPAVTAHGGYWRVSSCSHRIREARTQPGYPYFRETATARGIAHEHRLSSNTWLLKAEDSDINTDLALSAGAVSAADLDGDCWPELLFAGAIDQQPLLLYKNQRGLHFQAATQAFPELAHDVGAIGIADINADGSPDIMAGNLLQGDMRIFTGSPEHGYRLLQRIPTSKATFGLAFADYNGDGWLDAYAAHWDSFARPGRSPALMKNAGLQPPLQRGALLDADEEAGTTHAYIAHDFNFSPAFADINQDMRPDLLIASDFATSVVLINTGNGRFQSMTDRTVLTDENGMGSAIGDFNGDGLMDWFVSSISNPENSPDWPWGTKTGNRLYLGKGNGAFRNHSATAGVDHHGWAWGSCAADFNNDGFLDIFIENGFGLLPGEIAQQLPPENLDFNRRALHEYFRSRPVLLLGQGDGSFSEQGAAWGLHEATNARGISCLDFDRDGDIDIAVAQNSGTPRLHENQSSGKTGGAFIGLRLHAPAPNRQAIGASVRLRTGQRWQTRQVAANSNYLGQNPAELHFGLGAHTRVTEVDIHWPDGSRSHFQGLPANRFIDVYHPALAAGCSSDPFGISTVACLQ